MEDQCVCCDEYAKRIAELEAENEALRERHRETLLTLEAVVANTRRALDPVQQDGDK